SWTRFDEGDELVPISADQHSRAGVGRQAGEVVLSAGATKAVGIVEHEHAALLQLAAPSKRGLVCPRRGRVASGAGAQRESVELVERKSRFSQRRRSEEHTSELQSRE